MSDREAFEKWVCDLNRAPTAWEAWQAALRPDDMTDWRNWREGDRVEYFGCTSSFKGAKCFIGAIADDNDRRFRVHKAGTDYFIWSYPHEIGFHSRAIKTT